MRQKIGEPKSSTITFTLEPSLRARLETQARQEGRSVSSMIRQLVMTALHREVRPLETRTPAPK